MDHFDYIIVGAGTAGSVLARRLVDAGASVCLLESGGTDDSPFVHIPGGFVKTLLDASRTWRYKTDPGPHIHGRRIPMVHGRMLGGTSSVNGLVFIRGQAEDFDNWARIGNPGWGFADVLPYFKKLEQRIGVADDNLRGRDGPIPVTDGDWHPPLCEAFIAAAASLGLPRGTDASDAGKEGTGYYQRNIYRGRRISAARGYLRPVMRRENLDVRLWSHVTAVLLEEGRAVGVKYVQDKARDQTVEIRAGEIILCAGALATPKLLQISGIGPGHLLQQLGVPVQHALPGVGENLRDHFTQRIIVQAKRGTSTINSGGRGIALGFEIARWLCGQPSILSLSAAVCHAFAKSDPALATPDMTLMFTPGSYRGGVLGLLDTFPGMTFGGWQMRPLSSGFVRARSPDPFQLPSIQPNYLEHETDQRVSVTQLRLLRRIMAAPAMAGYCAKEVTPGRHVTTDDELLEYARQTGTICCHPVGTCRMGPAGDAAAVVDAELAIHGLRGLRVVDASIMPMITSGNTHAPTMMIAEKAADLILRRTARAVPDYDA